MFLCLLVLEINILNTKLYDNFKQIIIFNLKIIWRLYLRITYSIMSFFGVTQLGYQNVFEENLNKPSKESTTYLPPIDNQQKSLYVTSNHTAYGLGPQGSYIEFCRLRDKHIRSVEGDFMGFFIVLFLNVF